MGVSMGNHQKQRGIYLVVLTQLKFKLNGLLHTFESPFSLLFFEWRDAQKFGDRIFGV
jgi:hypothetical protein